MHRSAMRVSRVPLLAAVLGLGGCAMSERGPDAAAFVAQARQVLGDAAQQDVPVAQLLPARWAQLCMHRQGSLNITLIELEERHQLRVPFSQLTVGEPGVPGSLDGQCLQRKDMVRLRRHGTSADAPIVFERVTDAADTAVAVAGQ